MLIDKDVNYFLLLYLYLLVLKKKKKRKETSLIHFCLCLGKYSKAKHMSGAIHHPSSVDGLGLGYEGISGVLKDPDSTVGRATLGLSGNTNLLPQHLLGS